MKYSISLKQKKIALLILKRFFGKRIVALMNLLNLSWNKIPRPISTLMIYLLRFRLL